MPLPDYGETLRPDFAVRELEPKDGAPPWQLLVRVARARRGLRPRRRAASGQLEASAHGRMERLLRQTGVPAGLLFNGRALRLVSAPRGESSGWLDFRVADMVQTAGRPISTALRLLLGQPRLLSLPRAQRLAALLEDSRKFQNEVSERLAEQVLHALYELLRGFQAAHDASKGELLREPLAEHPDEVYRALLTVILRLVFLLYAEERDMLPEDETFLRYYSLAGLYERLREDAALFPDTMDQRYGAWAQLLVLFRMIHDGAESGAMRLPKRHGVLFDPDRFKFLEGRPSGGARQIHERIEPPLVPDGTIYRALEKLLVLDGERISYRALDVEQIGSVYETMMGFRLETATGRSVAIKAPEEARRAHGGGPRGAARRARGKAREVAPGPRRPEAHRHGQEGRGRGAATLEDLHAALLPVIDLAATPDLVPQGRDGAPAERGAAPLGLALHAALAHRADRAHDARADPRAPARRRRPAAPARADPRPQGLRPGDGLGRVPRRGLPPARRRAGRGLARPRRGARDPARRGRGDLRAHGWSRSAASTAWTGTPWRWTSPRCRSGS